MGGYNDLSFRPSAASPDGAAPSTDTSYMASPSVSRGARRRARAADEALPSDLTIRSQTHSLAVMQGGGDGPHRSPSAAFGAERGLALSTGPDGTFLRAWLAALADSLTRSAGIR